MHYQPVVDLATGAVDGVEALVRWRHPTRGLLMPGDFVPIAEGSELIDGSASTCSSRRVPTPPGGRRPGHPVSVAVNVSAAQLTQVELSQTVSTALYNSGLPAHALVVEITETALLRAPRA